MDKKTKPSSKEVKKDVGSFHFDVPDEILEKMDEQIKFEEAQNQISPMILNKELFSVAPELKGKMIFSIILACIGEVFSFASYFFGAYAASWLIRFNEGNGIQYDNLIKYSIVALLLLVVHLILTGFSTVKSHKIAFAILAELRIRLFEKLKEIPLGYMVENPVGKIKVTIQDRVSELEDWIAHIMPELPSKMLHPILATIILFVMDWRIGLSIFAPLPVIIVATMIMMHKYRARFLIWTSSYSDVAEKSSEYVRGIPVIKAFLQNEKSYKQFSDSVNFYHKSTMDWWKNSWLGMALSLAAMMTPLIVTLPLAINLYSNGEITITVLLLSIILPLSILPQAMSLMNSFELYSSASGSWMLIRELLFMQKQKRPDDNNRAKTDNTKGVEFKNVSFSYIDGVSILNNVSFTAKSNETTAIVGPSGSGKSTIAKLISGYWDINEGDILVSGADTKKMPFSQLMEEISYVSQENYLFDTSIKDNIKIGKPDATDEEVIEAAKAANCHDFIMNLKDGYDSKPGDAGNALSGGEKQRITLARAILKPSNIIVLDEATAYADPENEALIQEAISRLVKDKTLIVIAHRLHTIQSADNILVIDHGEIVASGKHSELLEKSSLYKRLNLQYGEEV